jgi:hypothetical protein
MMRCAIALLVISALVSAGCSGKSKHTASPGTGSGSAAIYAKRFLISFGITQNASAADVFLQSTDETGKQVSHALGSFDGQCQVIKPAEDMKAVTGVNCTTGSAANPGVELDAVIMGDEVIVLKLPVQVGTPPDPMSRTEVARVKAPAGSSIELDPAAH